MAHIRAVYNQVKKEIAAMEPNNPNNAYYVLHCENNAWAKPFPAVGTYHITTDFYYRFNPETADKEPVMIIQTAELAAVKCYTEILYQGKQCIFYYENDPYETDPEKRLYIDARGRTIRYTEGSRKIGPYDETKESTLRDNAQDYLNFFNLL